MLTLKKLVLAGLAAATLLAGGAPASAEEVRLPEELRQENNRMDFLRGDDGRRHTENTFRSDYNRRANDPGMRRKIPTKMSVQRRR